MDELAGVSQRILEAGSIQQLEELERELERLTIADEIKVLGRSLVQSRRQTLESEALVRETAAQRDESEALARETAAQRDGVYFADAQFIYHLGAAANDDPAPDQAFNMIRRTEVPAHYAEVVEKANEAHRMGWRPNFKAAQSNTDFVPGRSDAFGGEDPGRAHVLPDSPFCMVSYGLMVEGATGPVRGATEEDKNTIRILRALGNVQGNEGAGFRTQTRNFVALSKDHKSYFDDKPQVALVPILTNEEITGWDGNDYMAAVLVMSKEGDEAMTVDGVYGSLLKNFDWGDFPRGDAGTCSRAELEGVFKKLRHWTIASFHSLDQGEPQALNDTAARLHGKKQGSVASGGSSKASRGSRGGKNRNANRSQDSSVGHYASQEGANGVRRNLWNQKKEELDLAKKTLAEAGLPAEGLPFLHGFGNLDLPRVLKVRVRAAGANYATDPFPLMVKAAINFAYCAYGCKLLPACAPCPSVSSEQNEDALSAEDSAADEPPVAFVVPAAGDDNVAGTPPARALGFEATRDSQEDWENLSDTSNVVPAGPVVVIPPSRRGDREGEDRENLSEPSAE